MDHARGQTARHERHLHVWGSQRARFRPTTGRPPWASLKEITVTAGWRWTRARSWFRLRPCPTRFDQLNVGRPTTRREICIRCSDRTTACLSRRPCRSGNAEQGTHALARGHPVDFGRPATRPTNKTRRRCCGARQRSATPRRVLLVSCADTTIAVTDEGRARGHGRRMPVRADTVAARGSLPCAPDLR